MSRVPDATSRDLEIDEANVGGGSTDDEHDVETVLGDEKVLFDRLKE